MRADVARQIAAIGKKPKNARAWARRILERHERRGGTVSPLALQMARAALNATFRNPRRQVRVPGEDDE